MINSKNAVEYLPFVKAMAEGKQVQCRGSNGVWSDNDKFSFSLAPCDYRIKPETIKVRLYRYDHDKRVYSVSSAMSALWKTVHAAATGGELWFIGDEIDTGIPYEPV